MTILTRTKAIGAPPEAIWAVLAELDLYHEWESGYVASSYTSDRHQGVGTTRRVELKSPMGVRFAHHEITQWREPEVIAWEARASNFPFLESAEQTVLLTPEDNQTIVQNRLDYQLKYGALGSLIDVVMFKRVVGSAADGFLTSLAMRMKM